MNLDNLTLVMSASSIVGLFTAVFWISRRFGELETKVNTMWAFQMRRAFSEVVTSGIGTVNSPMRFSDVARDSLDPIKAELEDLWARFPKNDDDCEVLLAIEEAFGERLLKLVCIPCGLSHGACLLLALCVAKGLDDIDINLTRQSKKGRRAVDS